MRKVVRAAAAVITFGIVVYVSGELAYNFGHWLGRS